MKFEIYTLIDITETKKRFDTRDKDWHRQQNFITLLNTIGLRSNAYYDNSPACVIGDPAEFGLGEKYHKHQHNIWKFEFDVEQENSLDIDMLNSDFNGIPFINDLSETADFEKCVFVTYSNFYKNISFKKL